MNNRRAHPHHHNHQGARVDDKERSNVRLNITHAWCMISLYKVIPRMCTRWSIHSTMIPFSLPFVATTRKYIVNFHSYFCCCAHTSVMYTISGNVCCSLSMMPSADPLFPFTAINGTHNTSETLTHITISFPFL